MELCDLNMKFLNVAYLIALACIFSSCGSPNLERHDLASEQLYVTAVTPSEDEVVDSLSQVSLVFSKPLIAETVTSRTIFIISQNDHDAYATDEWDDLQDDVVNGTVWVLDATIQVNEGDQSVTVILNEIPEPGLEYVIVALPQIQSQDYFPLNQVFGGSLNTYFVSRFSILAAEVEMSDAATTSEETTVISSEESGDVSDSFTEASEDDSSTASYPEVTSAEASEAVTSNEETQSDDVSLEEVTTESFNWSRVLITEVVTDPQQDHSESTPGNGIEFDEVPGGGTVSSSDEYIEIFNGTSDAVDMSQWSLNMLDGTDVLQDLSTETTSSVGPGEFLVVGNPTGAINNTVTIELLNESDVVIDSVAVEDANASGIEDEAYYLNEEGEWSQGIATPGEFE